MVLRDNDRREPGGKDKRERNIITMLSKVKSFCLRVQQRTCLLIKGERENVSAKNRRREGMRTTEKKKQREVSLQPLKGPWGPPRGGRLIRAMSWQLAEISILTRWTWITKSLKSNKEFTEKFLLTGGGGGVAF